MKEITHASLFSGIGGFDIAAEWMGWENAFHCEWNEFGQKVLKYYWPNAESFNDITKSNFTKYANKIDILTGGFPCQPYSTAGKRLGKDDERHLWPEMLRAIREIKPKWVIGENVYGLVNWNGGMVFEEVQAQLEDEGYEVQPIILPACSVGAPHRRDRVWFVSRLITNCSSSGREWDKESKKGCDCIKCRIPLNESDSFHGNGVASNNSNTRVESVQQKRENGIYESPIITDSGLQRQTERQEQSVGIDKLCQKRNATDTGSKRPQRDEQFSEHKKENKGGETSTHGTTSKLHRGDNWRNWPTQPPICGGNDGFPSRLDGITFPKWRNESIKAYGNAIVPQVAYEIFKAIQLFDDNHVFKHTPKPQHSNLIN